MLLTIDVGNTGITFGIFDNEDLIHSFSTKTSINPSKEKFRSDIINKLKENSIDPSGMASIVSSVVPEVKDVITLTVNNITGLEPVFVSHRSRTDMPILYDFPEEVGADRIVNAVAAFNIFNTSTIVVDFGTATTFDCISANGEYMGGAIAPGIKISSDALTQKTSKLPEVNIEKPQNIIGRNTVDSMQSGIFYGHVSLVDGMVPRLKQSMDTDPVVVATGGFSEIISSESRTIQHVDKHLTLKGLRLLYKLNG